MILLLFQVTINAPMFYCWPLPKTGKYFPQTLKLCVIILTQINVEHVRITWWKTYIWLIGKIIIISKSFQDNTFTNQGDYIVSSIPNVSLNSEATSVKVIINQKRNKDVNQIHWHHKKH